MAALIPIDQEGLAQRFAAVRRHIEEACRRTGRDPQHITLVAVSKLQPAEAVAAALALGHRDFGENYAQELRDKALALAEFSLAPAPRWHFIGPLQRNKVRLVAGRASLIHTVDSVPLMQAIAARVGAQGPQDCLIQVNVGAEQQKAGCSEQELPVLLDAMAGSGGTVRCLGLMCIPPASEDPEQSRPYFRRLRLLAEQSGLRELSMGMSHDFAVAIEEGATILRIGTALFGPRPGV